MLETFIWADGQRPTPKTLDKWIGFIKPLGFSGVFILLNDVDHNDPEGDGEDWIDDNLIAASDALRQEGLWVGWMWWLRSKRSSIKQQLDDLNRLFLRFVPDKIQFDAEESWRDGSMASELNGGLATVYDTHNVAPITSITAIVGQLRKGKLRSQDAALTRQPLITEAYGQSYLFYNPKSGHWSHHMPKAPGELQRLTYAAWEPYAEEGSLETLWVGNAAHMQNIPGVKGLDGMRHGLRWAQEARAKDKRYAGVGWWSLKHIKGKSAAAKRAIIQSASGAPVVATPSNTGHPEHRDLSKVTAYNQRASRSVGWAGQLPEFVLERFPNLTQSAGSVLFAEGVLAYQADNELTEDGKLGPGTWDHMLETYGLPMPQGSFSQALGWLADGRCVERPGVRLAPADLEAEDWRRSA